jgi:monoamine oxidase
MKGRLVIIGAGAAGLAAACELAKAGLKPLILEARARAGGRIHTLRPADGAPIELGAEFLHGKPPELERLANEHHLAKRAVADEHWRIDHGAFQRFDRFWDRLAEVFGKIPARGADKSYCKFLECICTVPRENKTLATDFVKGFHAADPHRISVRSIAQSEKASEEVDGTKQFRFVAGYGELIRAMVATAISRGAQILFNHAVSRIEWKPRAVTITAREIEEFRRFDAEAVIVTLPLGVLQADAVHFDPPIFGKEKSLRLLAMGNVVKVNMQLSPGIWPDEKDGFIHLASESFLTWWKAGNVITAWAGGPNADALAKGSSLEIINTAMEALACMFGTSIDEARAQLDSVQYHDWRKDPFARGAYSYVPLGALKARDQLARPVSRTLFFAGEATAQPGFQGTVHGAVESGIRAAREVLGR